MLDCVHEVVALRQAQMGISYNTAWRMWKRGQRAFLPVTDRNRDY